MNNALYGFRAPQPPACSLRPVEAHEVGIPVLNVKSLFPPRPILDLLCDIDSGQADTIHLIEWVRLFSDEEGWRECEVLANKQLVHSFLLAALSRDDVRYMALSRMSESAQHEVSAWRNILPSRIYDELEHVVKKLDEPAKSAVELLLALRKEHYDQVVYRCFSAKRTPRRYFELNTIYFDWNKESVLAKALGEFACLGASEQFYFTECCKGMPEGPRLSAVQSFLHDFKGDQFGKKAHKALDAYVKPFSGQYWSQLDEPARKKVLSIYGKVSLDKLYALLKQIDEADKQSNEQDRTAKNIHSRVMFWMNFSASIRQFRLLLSHTDHQAYAKALQGVNIAEYAHGGDGEPMVLLLDLGSVIAMQFLGGSVAEIRFLQPDAPRQNALFDGSFVSADELRREAFDSFCDHVFGWQYCAEKQLRLKYEVLPNANIKSFQGLPKAVSNIHPGYGLQRSADTLTQRNQNLQGWSNAFLRRENSLGVKHKQAVGKNVTQGAADIQAFLSCYPLQPVSASGRSKLLRQLAHFRIHGKSTVELISASNSQLHYHILQSYPKGRGVWDALSQTELVLEKLHPVAVDPAFFDEQRYDEEQKRRLISGRYWDNLDGTVTDRQTGLQWMRFSLGQIWENDRPEEQAGIYLWAQLTKVVREFNANGGYGGYRDWCVPSLDQLKTLIKTDAFPTIDLRAFPNTMSDAYWTSSKMSFVHFRNGNFYHSFCDSRELVRLVRSGQ